MKLGVPEGHLRVMREDLARRGISFDEAAHSVEAHGGYSERRRPGIGSNYGRLDVWVSLIVPEAALHE